MPFERTFLSGVKPIGIRLHCNRVNVSSVSSDVGSCVQLGGATMSSMGLLFNMSSLLGSHGKNAIWPFLCVPIGVSLSKVILYVAFL